VAQVQIFGQKRFSVRVRAHPDALAARGLTLDELPPRSIAPMRTRRSARSTARARR
jgi:hypothetical protein